MIKELEDHSWFKGIFRRFQAEYIGSIAKWFKLYEPLIPSFQKLIDENKLKAVHDLCSGSGIPAINMHEQMNGISKTILSDKFPVQYFINTNTITYSQLPVDVLLLDPQPAVCYTMYNSFHHFSTEEQKAVVKKMVMARSSFLIGEILTPGIFTMIKIILTTTLLQLFTVPFVRPFSLLRLIFTYIIPVNLFTVTYDGIISVMRSRTGKQYKTLLAGFPSPSYKISIDQYYSWKCKVVCIKGDPST